MANNVAITPGSGANVTTVDISSFGSYPTTGQVPAGVLYCSAAVGTVPAPVTTSNPLSVSLQNSTVAVTQSGTWNITNVSGTISLPTGASTAAKQPALGTAGTASSDVISIQGIASMTPLQIADNGGSLTVDGTVAATQSGTWNVGTVTTVSTVSSVTTLPARTATADAVTAKLATDTIQNGLTALTPKFATIAASSSGNTTVVTAVTSKKIRVLRFTLISNGSVNVKFRSSTGGDITGSMPTQQYSGTGAAFCPVGVFETVAGETLQINLDSAVSVGGFLTYVEV